MFLLTACSDTFFWHETKGDLDQVGGQGSFEERKRPLNLSQAVRLGHENSGACSNQLLVGLLPF